MNGDNFLVSVRCPSYNHAPFIIDCMNGFIIQETNFPYVCVIDDDASTDGAQDIIKDYLDEQFNMDDKDVVRKAETDDYFLIFARHKRNKNCFFAVYFLKYNHYSMHKSRIGYMTEFVDNAKYCAICEGDDYWIAPNKLQEQVDYLECHEKCSMVCNRTKMYSQLKQKYVGEYYCEHGNTLLKAEDIINRGGLYISTCSIVYRGNLLKNYPDYCKQCVVGDWPLQIFMALNGFVYYIDKCYSVYRIDNNNSFMGNNSFRQNPSKRFRVMHSILQMLNGFFNDYKSCQTVIRKKKIQYLLMCFPHYNSSWKLYNEYCDVFKDEINKGSIVDRLYFKLLYIRIPIRVVLFYTSWRKYQAKIIKY